MSDYLDNDIEIMEQTHKYCGRGEYDVSFIFVSILLVHGKAKLIHGAN